MSKNKLWLKLSTALSLFSVLVVGVSTLAWFQLDSQNPQAKMVTGSDNMEIDNENVVGYKINTPLGETGFRDYAADKVENMTGEVLSIDNGNKAEADTDYDLPSEGVGFYLVRRNPSGTFRYKYGAVAAVSGEPLGENEPGEGGTTYYTREHSNEGAGVLNDGVYKYTAVNSIPATHPADTYFPLTVTGINPTPYYTKMATYSNPSTVAYIDNISLTAGEVYRVRQYNFDSGHTVHQQIKIASTTGAGTTYESITDGGDIEVETTGNYRVWIDYTYESFEYDTDSDGNNDLTLTGGKLGFEPINVTSSGVVVRNSLNEGKSITTGIEKKARRNVTASKNTIYIETEDQKNGWAENQYFSVYDNGTVQGLRIKITAATFATGSGYSNINQIPTEKIIVGSLSGTYVWYNSTDSCLYADMAQIGWGDSIYKYKIELPWIFSSITYTYLCPTMSSRKMLTTGMTASNTSNQYYDKIWHDSYVSASEIKFQCSHNTNGGNTTDAVDYKPAYYFDARLGCADTGDNIHEESVLYWTRYDPTAVSVNVTGREFVAWYASYTSNTDTFSTQFTGPITWHEDSYWFLGEYNYATYNITYLDGGGGPFSGVHESGYPDTHTYGTDTTLFSATKDGGYTFGGWYTTSSCTGNPVTTLGAEDYTGDITLYAKWSIVVTISNGTGVKSVYLSTVSTTATSGSASGTEYAYGTTVYGFAVLDAGYDAPLGWTYISNTGSGANTENAKYYVGSVTAGSANFGELTANLKSFTISFNRNNNSYGSLNKYSVTVHYGATYSTSNNVITFKENEVTVDSVTATPAAAGSDYNYTFGTWSSGSGTITSTDTITANFVKNWKVILSKSGNYGTLKEGNTEKSYVYVPDGTAYITTQTGSGASSSGTLTLGDIIITATPNSQTAQYTYAFTGWSSASGTISSATTITATFTRTTRSYSVTFNLQGHGSSINPQTITYNGKVTEPSEPTASGYHFAGWYKESSCINAWSFSTDVITGNKTLYAKWEYELYLYDVSSAWDDANARAWNNDQDNGANFYRTSKNGNLYKFYVPVTYDRIIFNKYENGDCVYNYSNQTIEMTLNSSCAGKYYAMYKNIFVGTGHNTRNEGEWYSSSSLAENSYYTYYAYNYNNSWTSVYAYLWDDTHNEIRMEFYSNEASRFSYTGVNNPTAYTVYELRLPKFMDNFLLFYDANATTTTSSYTYQSADCDNGSASYLGKYFVTSNNTWYAVGDLLSTTAKTYYVYDPNNVFGGTIKAYAYITNAGGTVQTGKFLYVNNLFPGIAMTQLQEAPAGHASFTPYGKIWKIVISESYNNIIFSNSDGTIKTVDLGNRSLTSYNGLFFTVTGGGNTSKTGDWIDHFIQLMGQYTINGSVSSYAPSQFAVAYQVSGETFTPGDYSSSAVYQVDNTNGICYRFTRSDEVWYEDSGCNDVYETPVSFNADATLYAKLNADLTNNSTTHKTIYLDIRDSYHTGDDTKHYYWYDLGDFTGVECRVATNTTFTSFERVAGVKVSQYIYRYTVPIITDCKILFKAITPSGTNSHYYCGEVLAADIGSFTTQKTIIHVNHSDTHDVNLGYSLTEPQTSSSLGTAIVQYYANGTWENTLVTMNQADGATTNDFAYEFGKPVPIGTEFRIKYTSPAGATTIYGSTVEDYRVSPLPFYLTTGSNGGMVTQGYGESARFNFYLNHSRKIDVNMVPDLGNGYYIMDSGRTSWSDPTLSYIMTDVGTGGIDTGKYSAQYKGIINFRVGNQLKVRTDNWINVTWEFADGVSSYLSTTTDGTNNLVVANTNGRDPANRYVLYAKVKRDGSGIDVWVDFTTESLSSYSGTDNIRTNFTEGYFYIVGNADFTTATSSAAQTVNQGFFGGKKMSMSTKDYAVYNGFYARPNSNIFIRSYIDAIDTLYQDAKSGGTGSPSSGCILLCGKTAENSDVQMSTSDGVITFNSNAGGYYNIYVKNGKVIIEPYTTSKFFRLNEIDSDYADSQDKIFEQKTALVLEIPFTSNNSYYSAITMSMTANWPSYVGAYLWVSADQIDDPYHYLHDGTESESRYLNLSSYSSGDTINDSANCIIEPNNNDHTYYAYILVDYLDDLPGKPASLTPSATQMYFYLTATQTTPPPLEEEIEP